MSFIFEHLIACNCKDNRCDSSFFLIGHIASPCAAFYAIFEYKIKKQIKYNELAKEVMKLSRGSLQADAPQAR